MFFFLLDDELLDVRQLGFSNALVRAAPARLRKDFRAVFLLPIFSVVQTELWLAIEASSLQFEQEL